MNEAVIQPWWVLTLRGLIAIVFGILTLMSPGITLLSLILLFATYALVGGAVSVFGAVQYKRRDDHWWLPLLWGFISIGAGAMALLHPGLSALIFVLLIGANALMTGMLDIVTAIRLRKSIEGEWLLAFNGLISVVFGIVVFLFPGSGALALVWLIGFYAIFTGALLIGLSLRLRSRVKQMPYAKERRVTPDRRMTRAYS
jgi:uncharacterized membrane protein HdeD (DUF308 family)